MVKGFNHKKIDPKELTFEYDETGYQLTYKGISIGGAGVNRKNRRNLSNLALYKDLAIKAKRDILEHGKCPEYMKKNIVDIDAGKLEWMRSK